MEGIKKTCENCEYEYEDFEGKHCRHCIHNAEEHFEAKGSIVKEQEIRNKAIDDFAERLCSKIMAEIDDCADELDWINKIAEQLKVGGSNV